MRDFLDNLLDRHSDAPPQIMPRLPSLFEPEAVRDGVHTAVFDTDLPEIEETTVRRSPQHAESTDLAAPIEPIPYTAAPVPTGPVNEEQSSAKTVLNKPVFSMSPTETSSVRAPSQTDGREGVGDVNSTSASRIRTLPERVTGSDEAPPDSSSPAAPVFAIAGRVRRADQPGHPTQTSPASEITTEEHTSAAGRLNRTRVVLPFRESVEEGTVSTGEPFTLSEGEAQRPQGLLVSSASSIPPITSFVAGPERPSSQPEPVINVTIGRIEVRAIATSPQPSQKSRSGSPVMTLEEYLRKRANGERQ